MITYATRNIIKFLFLFFFAISNQNVFSQDLEEEPAENPINLFDYLGNDGWYSLPPEIQISITEFFDLYREQLGMQENDEMIRLNPDEEILDNIPIFYQQFYKGFEVEKAIVMIITENSYIKKMKCNIALGLSFDVNGDIISENDALSKALETLNAEEYAWQNLDNEMGLIIDQNNLNATNYPTGKLLIGKANGIEIIPESYMFAWKFDILCSAPRKLRSVYVDPLNGQVTTGCVQGELSAVPMPNYNFDLQPNISDEFDNTLNPNLWTHSENFACINGVNYSENFGTTGVNTQVNSYTGW